MTALRAGLAWVSEHQVLSTLPLAQVRTPQSALPE